jgi:3-carboxy-cis,cis-muconate cycloisomerase
VPDYGMLVPGIGDGDPDDVVVVKALVRAEVAWVEATADEGIAEAVATHAARILADELRVDTLTRAIAIDAVTTGNPVFGIINALREGLPSEAAAAIHRDLTSQDIVDTAMMLTMRDAADLTVASLDRVCASLAALALEHRDVPVLAHTLGQAALPTTFGARVAGWLHGIDEARRALAVAAHELPVAMGGAVGAMHGVSYEQMRRWAELLDLRPPIAPWHVHRHPVTRIAGAFSEVCTELGATAGDVLAGARPEVGELKEPSAEGRGASTAMPFKANPILSILMRRSALVAPHLLAQTAAAAALAVDERPDGAWHTEWDAARGLARHAVISSRCAAQLAEGLIFDRAAAARNLAAHGPADATTGNAGEVVDAIIARYEQGR